MPRPASMFVATGVAAAPGGHGQVHPAQVQLDGADPALVVRCQCGGGRRRQPQVLLRPGRDPVQRRGERAPGQRHRQQRDRDQAAPRAGERPHQRGPPRAPRAAPRTARAGRSGRPRPAAPARSPRRRAARAPASPASPGIGAAVRARGRAPVRAGPRRRGRHRAGPTRAGSHRSRRLRPQRGPRRAGSAPCRPGSSPPGPVARRRPGRCGCGAAGTAAWRRPRSAAGPRRGSATPRRGRPRPRSRSGSAARPCDSAGLVSRVRARRAAAPSRRCRAPRRCRRRPRRRNPPGRARDRCRSGVRLPRRRRRSAGLPVAWRDGSPTSPAACCARPNRSWLPGCSGRAPRTSGDTLESAPRARWAPPVRVDDKNMTTPVPTTRRPVPANTAPRAATAAGPRLVAAWPG